MTEHEPTRNLVVKGLFALLKDKFFIGGAVIVVLVIWAGWGSGDITGALHEIAEAVKAMAQ